MKEEDTKDSGGDLPVPTRPGAKQYTSWGEMARHWPLTTFLIISNEFCERFSYYGMGAVLTFYLLNVLKFSGASATIYYNSFAIVAYVTPILGSIEADGYIGKFWTIFTLSIVHAVGQVMLAISSLQTEGSSMHPVLDLVGLVIIALGTGGIKPCVAPFGADQFEKGQERMISVYFSMFYFSINAGSMISGFITPLFRAMPCLGQDSCYPLCFGVSAALMLGACGFFMIGSFWYKKPARKENVFAEVAKVIGVGLFNAIRGRGPKRAHVLEHFLDTHDCASDKRCAEIKQRRPDQCHKATYVADVQSLLRVLLIFLPTPMFWALYNQQGSIWLLQGIQMDCNIGGGVLLLPDQIFTLSALLILVFIPLFQAIVYPVAELFFAVTPLRKMVAGGWVASLAFLVTGFVQLQVNTTLPSLPASDQAFVSFMNLYEPGSGCTFTISSFTQPDLTPVKLTPNTSMEDNADKGQSTFHINASEHNWRIAYSDACPGFEKLPTNISYSFSELTSSRSKDGHTNVFFIAIGPQGAIIREVNTAKPTEGTGEFSLGLTLAMNSPYDGNLAVCRLDADDFDHFHPCNPHSPSDFYFWQRDYDGGSDDLKSKIHYITSDGIDSNSTFTASAYIFKSVKPGRWGVFFLQNKPKDDDHPPTLNKTETRVSKTGVEFEINGQGGVYAFVLTGRGNGTTSNKLHAYQVVLDNKVSILWQIPQIAIITAAEILFSVTGYEFAYTQAAPSMKTVVQALWLLTTALGNFIIVGITAADLFDNMATQFFAYAGAMFVVICIFALISIFFYEYPSYLSKSDDDDEGTLALENLGFIEDEKRKE